jgi:Fe-S cluster assembly ATP-binding protein
MAIMGFSNYQVTQGDIIFKGKRVNDLTIDERVRMGLGMMLQRPPAVRGVKTRQMLELAKQGGFNIEKESAGLNLSNFLDRDINLGFSGGELKRSELLQLLACSPSFAMFDEPESGVDLENIALVGKVMNRIFKNNKDNAGLIITHTGYIFDYVKADAGCIMVGGRFHCLGDPKSILETIKTKGYQWCITCEGERLKRKSRSPRA